MASAALPFILPGLGFLGGLLGDKTRQNQSGTSTTTGSSTSTPTLAPEYTSLRDLLLGQYKGLLSESTPGLPKGYENTGIENINNTYRNIAQSQTNRLINAGLTDSPVAGLAATNLEAARGGDIARFLNSIPLLEQDRTRQYQGQLFGGIADLLRLGTGTSSTTSGTTNTTGNISGLTGGGLGGGLSGLGAILGQQYANGNIFGVPVPR